MAYRSVRGAGGGFTLIEMIVVVSLIALLLAIAIPVSVAVVKTNQRSSTLSTMQVIETAIATFTSERPLSANGTYEAFFGPFPPSPVSSFRLSNLASDFAAFGPTGFDRSEPGFVVPGTPVGGTKVKFEMLIRSYLVPQPPDSSLSWYYDGDFNPNNDTRSADPGWSANTLGEQDPYLSIETCILFMRVLSPKARAIIDKLSPKQRTNQVDPTVVDPAVAPAVLTANVSWVPGWVPDDYASPTRWDPLTPVTHDLYKVLDAWGRPLRYAVQVPMRLTIGTETRVVPRRWELRSAGPDGKFSPTFTADGAFTSDDAANASDDVVLRGP